MKNTQFTRINISIMSQETTDKGNIMLDCSLKLPVLDGEEGEVQRVRAKIPDKVIRRLEDGTYIATWYLAKLLMDDEINQQHIVAKYFNAPKTHYELVETKWDRLKNKGSEAETAS